MTLLVVVSAGLLLAVCGLATVRSATPSARLLALLVALGFAVVASLSGRAVERVVAPRARVVDLDEDVASRRTQLLRAAAVAGPRVEELSLRWRAGLAGAPPDAAFGADTAAPPSMPFAPADVVMRGVARAAVDRPALLEIEVADLDREVVGEVVLRDPDGDILRQAVALGAAAVEVPFTPARPGRYEVSLEVPVGDHRVVALGSFDVSPPEELLVVERTGVVAAALRAQGERVREASSWPSDWRRHRRIVLGEALGDEQQRLLVEAVRDGLGLFLLAGAFGADGAPLRAVLPVVPAPQPDDDAQGLGEGGGTDEATDEPSEALDPPSPPPPPPERVGDTKGAAPISEEPVEVDKHAIAMVMVVDRSGSMGVPLANGMTKMAYAKESAQRSAQELSEGDRVGIVTFGDKGAGSIELNLTDATERTVVRAGIAKLVARQEYTFLLSGLRSADALLRRSDAAVKQVVVISDGEFVDQGIALTAQAASMREQGGITVSIIGVVSSQTDPEFKRMVSAIARAGGGLPLLIDDPGKIVKVVSGEVTRALSKVGRTPNRPGDGEEPAVAPEPPPPEEPEPPPPPEEPEPQQPEPPPPLQVFAVSESPILLPEPERWPPLGAAVACDAPIDARVLLVAGAQGWPLLSFANRGLGRVGAFGADLGGAACEAFRAAPAFPAWLAQWVAAVDVAQVSAQPEDVRTDGAIEPAAPVPADLAYLEALGGGSPRVAGDRGRAPAAVVGVQVVEQVGVFAPLLLPLLLLLAIAERLLAGRALRQGRG